MSDGEKAPFNAKVAKSSAAAAPVDPAAKSKSARSPPKATYQEDEDDDDEEEQEMEKEAQEEDADDAGEEMDEESWEGELDVDSEPPQGRRLSFTGATPTGARSRPTKSLVEARALSNEGPRMKATRQRSLLL